MIHQERSLPHYFLANSLTLTRAALALGMAISVAKGEPSQGILLGLGAIPTEADGRIARAGHAQSAEGAVRDNLADLGWFTATIATVFSQLVKIVPADRIPDAGLYLGETLAVVAIPVIFLAINSLRSLHPRHSYHG